MKFFQTDLPALGGDGLTQGQRAPLVLGTFGSLSFWLGFSGFAVREVVGVVAVVAAISVWGYAVIRLLVQELLDSRDIGFWLLGPCVGLGSLALLFLRVVTTRQVFLWAFAILPAVVLVNLWFRLEHRRLPHPISAEFISSVSRHFLLCTGLTGVLLSTRWSWTLPITAVALGAGWVAGKRVSAPVVVGGVVATLIVGLRAVGNRPESWWRAADGIPFDETILESVSNGLIFWGPAVSPTNDGLSGITSVAYHHLLYLIVGLINWFSNPVAYQALLVGTPILTAVCIVASLMLLTRHLLCHVGIETDIPAITLFGVIVCLQGLRGEGMDSPSSWFGVAAMFSAMVVTIKVLDVLESIKCILLISMMVIVVAFAKGPFVYAPVLFALLLSLFNWKQRWRISASALLTAAITIGFFSLASVSVSTFYFDFWPRRKMYSDFDLSFYNLLIFVDVLLLPVLLGLACVLVLLASKGRVLWPPILALVLIVIAAVSSQLLITSSGPRSFELFYLPGVAASSLLILILGVQTGVSSQIKFAYIVGLALPVLTIVGYVPRLESKTLTPVSAGVLLVVGFALVVPVVRFLRLGASGSTGSVFVSAATTFLLLLGFVTYLERDYLERDYPNLRAYSRPYPVTEYSNWYGTENFVATARYIRNETDIDAMFAYSLCDFKSLSNCEFDLRPAVFMQRKFLALDPVFGEFELDRSTWRDVEVSRSIGVSPVLEIQAYLRTRQVRYLLLNRGRVSDDWILDLTESGGRERFRNDEYVVVELSDT